MTMTGHEKPAFDGLPNQLFIFCSPAATLSRPIRLNAETTHSTQRAPTTLNAGTTHSTEMAPTILNTENLRSTEMAPTINTQTTHSSQMNTITIPTELTTCRTSIVLTLANLSSLQKQWLALWVAHSKSPPIEWKQAIGLVTALMQNKVILYSDLASHFPSSEKSWVALPLWGL